jgi:5-formyltetrahydrofolate cyclo-ligase
MDDLRKLHSLFESREFRITYSPLADEARIEGIMPERGEIYVLPAHAANDPLEEVSRVVQLASERTACILVPGTRFDTLGTRHGRGGGWYDRFLAALPEEWLRIGVCSSNQLSRVPLVRASWDEPMDYVVVVDREGERISLYATDARPNLSSTEPL